LPYTKTVWSTGDIITASLANNWEKQYDEALAWAQAKIDTKVAKSGDTMTGNLMMKGESIISTERVWTAPTLLNGWVAVGNGRTTPGYYRDGLGFVRLKGMVSSGTMGAAIFTLPVGLRPSETRRLVILTGGGVGAVDIDTNGNVIPIVYGTANNSNLSLDGIHFNL
jgi:hypothetical protein